MKKSLLLTLLFIPLFSIAQNPVSNFGIRIEKTAYLFPPLHSFVWAKWKGKWLILGGRTDGLHKRQPFAAFSPSENNTFLYVIDPDNGKTWKRSVLDLGTTLSEQLQSTNMNFIQKNEKLYCIGGYGYSPTADEHITFPYLTVVDVPATITGILNGDDIHTHFRQLKDPIFRVTGGQLGYLNGEFYLAGGQNFEGRYNPMGPDRGPGFFQEYTNEVRIFSLNDDGVNITIGDYRALHDSLVFHRRDYNMVPQVFNDGTKGFTIFSGVFQYGKDTPWLDIVDLDSSGFKPVRGFEQKLSQYHSAKIPVYDPQSKNMFTIFLGGLGRYYFDSTDFVVDDIEGAFVKTISIVCRDENGSANEWIHRQQMPGFYGGAAEFIPAEGDIWLENEILDFSQITEEGLFVGYVAGGIHSDWESDFFFAGEKTRASSELFKVYLFKSDDNESTQLEFDRNIRLELSPNPCSEKTMAFFKVIEKGEYRLDLIDYDGKVVQTLLNKNLKPGRYFKKINLKNLSDDYYFLTLSSNNQGFTVKVVIE